MTAIKLASALTKNAVPDKLANDMWDGLNGHHMAIVDFRVAERTEPADEAVEKSARLVVAGIEFARTADDSEHLRRALKARWEARTSVGTLTEGLVDETGVEVDTPGFVAALVDFVNAEGAINGHTATAKITPGGCTVTIAKAPEAE